MYKEIKEWKFNLIKKDDTIISDTLKAPTLEEAIFIIDRVHCLGMYKEFKIKEAIK